VMAVISDDTTPTTYVLSTLSSCDPTQVNMASLDY